MPIFNPYSKRQKQLPDVFEYEEISEKLKNQVYHIWNDFFKQRCFNEENKKSARYLIYNTICKEEGLKSLHFNEMFIDNNPVTQVEKYFEELKEADKVLDVIEITFFFIGRLEYISKEEDRYIEINYSADKAIKDLNQRFRENGIGYEFNNGQIIRIDNKLLHKEIVQPALLLLTNPEYKNVNEEFLKAHEHFRHQRNHECLNECLKAFESTMKIICKENKYPFKETDTAKSLINILIQNNFFPSYHENQLNSIRQQLEGNIPTIRNKNSGHGQGTNKIVIPDRLVSFMLYTTGATIILLIETQLENKKIKEVTH